MSERVLLRSKYSSNYGNKNMHEHLKGMVEIKEQKQGKEKEWVRVDQKYCIIPQKC